MADNLEREKEIFSEALDLPSLEARDAFLRNACGSDHGLREKIGALLAAFEAAEKFIPTRYDNPAPSMEASVPVTEQPGDSIGRYKLLEKLGEGGFGIVYMAEQKEPVKRRVALKIIKVGMDTREVVARFEAERQALALMDHPNIAKIFDAGATGYPLPSDGRGAGGEGASCIPSGRPYFVMELVRGIKLTEYCDERNVPTRERLELFMQVCQAVQHAHQKGIIHRDLKPSNILVTVNDGQAVPKIIDFGIAKATQMELTEKTVFTRFQQFIGTPAYMSPEQADISSVDVDTRSDIYSLGVLLYELLTGTTPFDTRELLKAGLDEMRRVIREKEPERPSTRLATRLEGRKGEKEKGSRDAGAVATLNTQLKSLSTDLDWIVMKCLEKDRARRYETATGLAADIQRHLTNEPVVARPPSAAYRFQKFVRRNKIAFTAAAAVLVVLLGGIIASTWQAVRATRAERDQSRLRQQAQAEALTSQRVTEFFQDMLRGARGDVAAGRDTTLLRDILDKTADRVDKEFKEHPDVEAKLRTTLGNAYEELGVYDKAEALHEGALSILRRLHGNAHTNIANSLLGVALGQIHRKNYHQAEVYLMEALELQKRLLGDSHVELTTPLINLAYVAQRRGDLVQSDAFNQAALAIARKTSGKTNPDVPLLLGNLGMNAIRRGDYSTAEKSFNEALALNRESPFLLEGLAEVMDHRRAFSQSDALRRKAAAVMRQKYPGGHPDMIHTLRNLARGLRDRDLPAAEAPAREAFELTRKFHREDSKRMADARAILVSVLRRLGKLKEIEEISEARVADARQNIASWTSTLESRLVELAEAFFRRGKYAEATDLYREALQSRRHRGRSEDTKSLDVAASLGRCLAEWAWVERDLRFETRDHKSEVVERAREAERLLSECLSSRTNSALSNDWRVHDFTSRLGFARVAVVGTDPSLGVRDIMARFPPIEATLLESNEKLQQEKSAQRQYKRDALLRLVRLYETWDQLAPDTGQRAKAQEWRLRLKAIDEAPVEEDSESKKETE